MSLNFLPPAGPERSARPAQATGSLRSVLELLEDRSVPAATLLSSSSDLLRSADAPVTVLGTSDDGQVVLAQSTATNIVPGQNDVPGTNDLFVFNLRAGTRTMITAAGTTGAAGFLPGTKAVGASVSIPGVDARAVISANGKAVAFLSGTNARVFEPSLSITSDDAGEDVFVWNSATNTVTLGSRDVRDNALGAYSGVSGVSVANDGSAVGFVSTTSSWFSIDTKFLVAKDTPDPFGTPDLYRAGIDITTNKGQTPFPVTYNRIVTPDGTFFPHFGNVVVDPLGRFMGGDSVSFVHIGTNTAFIGATSTDAIRSTFAGVGLTGDPIDTVITGTSAFGGASGVTTGNAILGRDRTDVIVFTAKVPTGIALVPGYFNQNGSNFELYRAVTSGSGIVRELVTEATGTTNAGQNGLLDLAPGGYNVTPDGRHVLFTTTATNIISGLSDKNKAFDVFTYDSIVDKRSAVSVTAVNPNRTGLGESRLPTQTIDGLVVAYQSTANDLTNIPDTNGVADIFSRDMVRRVTAVASVVPGNFNTGNAESILPVIGGGTRGGRVYYSSGATDLDRDFELTGDPQVFATPTPILSTNLSRTTGIAGGSTGFAGIGNVDLDGNIPLNTRFQPFPGFTGEVRVATGDVNNDGILDLIVGAGAGGGPRLLLIDGFNGRTLLDQFVFEAKFTGGIYVGSADINNDGRAEVLVGAGEGGGPRYRILDSITGLALVDRFAYEASARTGVRVTSTDFNGDGTVDIVVAAGFGGGPRVRVFDGTTLNDANPRTLADFFAFESGQRGGVYVAAGDYNLDGKGDIAVGAGPGGAPRVAIFDAAVLQSPNPNLPSTFVDFFPFDTDARDGVRVALKDIDGDQFADLVVGTGAGIPIVKTYAGGTLSTASTPLPLEEFVPFNESFGFFGANVG